MDKIIALTEYNWVLWIAGLFALLEFGKWAWSLIEYYLSKIDIETKSMRQKREYETRLKNAEQAIQEIKEASKNNVQMFLNHEEKIVEKFSSMRDELIIRLDQLDNKFIQQQEENNRVNEANDAVDRALLRDRLNGGLRFFSQNVDEQGRVHISVGDHENMEKMFQEYFNKHGNGTMEQRYKKEFKHYIIDDQKFN